MGFGFLENLLTLSDPTGDLGILPTLSIGVTPDERSKDLRLRRIVAIRLSMEDLVPGIARIVGDCCACDEVGELGDESTVPVGQPNPDETVPSLAEHHSRSSVAHRP